MTDLLFLPGAGGGAAFWRPVAERLGDLGPTHVLGYPGFGDVPADPRVASLDDLFGWLLERLPPRKSHVVAQSMGGVLAARLRAPRRLGLLVQKKVDERVRTTVEDMSNVPDLKRSLDEIGRRIDELGKRLDELSRK